jgi:cell division inhibitor SepF
MSLGNKLKDFFGFSEEDGFDSHPRSEAQSLPTPTRTIKSAPTSNTSNRGFGSSEIKVEEPRIYEDSLNIATYLRESKPVIINLKHLDSNSGKRLIDFVCGTAYAINGHMMKIGENIFLFTPSNVLIESGEKSPLEKGLDHEERENFFRRNPI